MTTVATRHERTRARLLDAGERLFADRGFKAVTVRDICREADANVAAVNYHFKDKAGLYREIIRVAIGGMQKMTDDARQVGAGEQPEEQLRRYISMFLQRLLVPGRQTMHRLIDREMSEPTPALDELVRDGLRPRFEYLGGILSKMLGCDPADRRVMLCIMSVQSQSLMYARGKGVGERLGFGAKPGLGEIDAIASHIADFSIGGIDAVRRSAPARRPRAGRRSERRR